MPRPNLSNEDCSCITVGQLKALIADWPEINPSTGEPYEVWCMTGEMASSPCTLISPLNKGDILFTPINWDDSIEK